MTAAVQRPSGEYCAVCASQPLSDCSLASRHLPGACSVPLWMLRMQTSCGVAPLLLPTSDPVLYPYDPQRRGDMAGAHVCAARRTVHFSYST